MYPKTREGFWLIDFSTFTDGDLIISFNELKRDLKITQKKVLTSTEFLEILNTLKICRGQDFSPQMTTFFVSDERKIPNEIMAFSTFIDTLQNKKIVVVIMISKKTKLMSGCISNGNIYYIFGNRLKKFVIIPTGINTGLNRKDFIFKTLTSL